MPFPIAHGLVGATIIALLHKPTKSKSSAPALIGGAFLAISPDFDLFFVWVLGFKSFHSTLTHSIPFAFFLTAFALICTRFTRPGLILAFGIAYLSHALLDFVTSNFDGVGLLYPFSNKRFSLGVTEMFEFLNSSIWEIAVKSSLLEIVVFVPIFIAALFIRKRLLKYPNEKSDN